MHRLGVSLLLVGCVDIKASDTDSGDTAADTDTEIDTDSGDTDTDTEIDMSAIAIDAVSPGYGGLAGGQDVLISGGPFSDASVVYFGEAEAEVSLATANELIVRVPAQEAEGWATITVIDNNQGGQLEAGYRYFANAEGLAGALGWSSWLELTGGYWEKGFSLSEGSLNFLFIEPAEFHAWEFSAPAMDSCVQDGDYAYGGSLSVLLLGVDEVSLTPQVGEAISVPYNPSGATNNYFYTLDPMTQTQHVAGGGYDLDPVVGGLFDGLEIEDLFRNPGAPEVLEPAISGQFAPTITVDQTFRWEVGNFEWVEISMGVVNAEGTAFDDFVTCVATNDGEFQIDSSVFKKWAAGRQVNIYFAGVREVGTVLPFNYSESRIVGEYRLLGAAFSQ